MITEGGINSKSNIRFNTVAPGVVDTPPHSGTLKTRTPIGTISDRRDIAEAVAYLTEARHITGEVPHVDDGAHVGRW